MIPPYEERFAELPTKYEWLMLLDQALTRKAKKPESVLVIGSGPSASRISMAPDGMLTIARPDLNGNTEYTNVHSDNTLCITVNEAFKNFNSDIHVSVDEHETTRLKQYKLDNSCMIGRKELAALYPERFTGNPYSFPGSGSEALLLGYRISQMLGVSMCSIGIDFGVFVVDHKVHHYATWHNEPRTRRLVRSALQHDLRYDAYIPNGFHRQTMTLKNYPCPHNSFSAITPALIDKEQRGIAHAKNNYEIERTIAYLKALKK